MNLEDSNPIRRKRRRVIKSVGSVGILGVTGLTQSVTADETDEEDFDQLVAEFPTDDIREVMQEIPAVQREYGFEVANKLLRESEGEYIVNRQKIGDASSTDEDFGTQHRYSESGSELQTILGGHNDEDGIWVTANMQFDGTTRYRERKPWNVEDLIGVTWDPDNWSLVGDPNLASDEHDPSFYSGGINGVSEGTLLGEVELNADPISGLPSEAFVSLQLELEHIGGPYTTVWSHYHHTRASSLSGSIDSITAEVGGLEVEFSGIGASEAFDPAVPGDTREACLRSVLHTDF